MKIDVQYIGSERLKIALDQLEKIGTRSPTATNKTIRQGLREGTRYLIRKGKARAKAGIKANEAKYPNVKHTGNLLRSFTTILKRNNNGALAGFHQGSKGDKRNGSHAHLVDEGHGGRRGPAKGSYFWTITRQQDGDDALLKVEEGIEKAVFRILG